MHKTNISDLKEIFLSYRISSILTFRCHRQLHNQPIPIPTQSQPPRPVTPATFGHQRNTLSSHRPRTARRRRSPIWAMTRRRKMTRCSCATFAWILPKTRWFRCADTSTAGLVWVWFVEKLAPQAYWWILWFQTHGSKPALHVNYVPSARLRFPKRKWFHFTAEIATSSRIPAAKCRPVQAVSELSHRRRAAFKAFRDSTATAASTYR